jgi:glycosyltransferase involved in cell wall biosynthesis
MKANWEVLIFSTVWPEPSSSAAGVRQLQWVDYFLSRGAQVTLSSPSKLKSESDWGSLKLPEGVKLLPLPLNDSAVLERLKTLNPDLVLFDRFILEEQFGHFVYEACPQALVLLETQDLHLVRRARDEAKDSFLSLTSETLPRDFYKTETALRETAAIERVDYSFVVSSFEERLLLEEFNIGKSKCEWLPFFYREPLVEMPELAWADRDAFVWVGNFRHPPNLDGLRWFRKEIWPRIRIRVPGAKLRIFGAYPTEEVMQWHKPQDGVFMMGSPDDLNSVFKQARVNLAPLRFGAGIKGKILEGFRHGIPTVTTSVGEEGLFAQDSPKDFFPGLIGNTVHEFVELAVKLYQDESLWRELQARAARAMHEVFSFERVAVKIDAHLARLSLDLSEGMIPTWTSRILRHEQVNSHKYFSRWIEAKERAQLPAKE